MIALIYHETSDHKFTLAVTDAKEQTTTKTLTFHLTAPATLTYNDDADLWANTATVTAENLPDGAKVQYRVKDGEWQDAALTEGSTYQIAPEWDETQNDAKLAIYDIKAGTGVFAGNTYEVRIAAEDGQAIGTPIEFDTRGGIRFPTAICRAGVTVVLIFPMQPMRIHFGAAAITYYQPRYVPSRKTNSGNRLLPQNWQVAVCLAYLLQATCLPEILCLI